MESNRQNPLCYSCKYRRDIPGDAHSECVHPKAASSNSMLRLMAMLGGRRGLPDVELATALGIKASLHGIRMGWFAWPFNFDPVWLENCDGYESKEELRREMEA